LLNRILDHACEKHLKNQRILITAGPTWVSIDPVRVISNTASGETGRLLAKSLAAGSQSHIASGTGVDIAADKKINVIRFSFFDDLKKILKDQLLQQYDSIIHSAAVPTIGLLR